MTPRDVLASRLAALGCLPRGLRVTRNRAVMVSLSSRGVVSVHEGYAQAPDRVLKAIVRFLAPHTPRALRMAAKHEILSFPVSSLTASPPDRLTASTRPTARPQPGDLERSERLTRMFHGFNVSHFSGTLPDLPIRMSGRMRTRLGQLCLDPVTGVPFEITMSRRHLNRHGWSEAAHTLLHEMVHLWQHATGVPVDHGPGFRAKAREVGAQPSARRTVPTAVSRGRAARYD